MTHLAKSRKIGTSACAVLAYIYGGVWFPVLEMLTIHSTKAAVKQDNETAKIASDASRSVMHSKQKLINEERKSDTRQ